MNFRSPYQNGRYSWHWFLLIDFLHNPY
uniref:Uncharacterized protein n=1 Tax=Lepeophtheirus salmonis TaxID=72036 RepID=A0A0K2VKN0_LEPSM